MDAAILFLLSLALPAMACDRHDASPAARATTSAAACPPTALLEELHAAAFYYEHGTAETARDHLRRARDLAAHESLDATATAALGSLGQIDQEIALRPLDAKNRVEQVRVSFADWPCLPQDVHERFHASLPPLR